MATAAQTLDKKNREFDRAIDRLQARLIRQLANRLNDLRRSIADQILSTGGLEAHQLNQLQNNAGRLVDSFGRQLTNDVNQSFIDAIRLGSASVTEPLQAAGLLSTFEAEPLTLQRLIDLALGFSAELITNITEPMRAQINTQLRLAVLGAKSPFNVMKEITNILGIKAGRLLVKGVAARAESILRTEVMRMFNLSTHNQQQRTARQVPGLMKEWVATNDDRTRPSHWNANGQRVPVDQPFIVNGFELMFPLDPAGPASETINCRCRPVTIHPDQ